VDVRRAGGVWRAMTSSREGWQLGLGSWQVARQDKARQGKTRQDKAGQRAASRDSANVLLARRMGGCSPAIKHEALHSAVKPTGEILLPTTKRKTLDD
jgi:hypothetical protein